ncbi:transcriptional regulator [Virgibacillus sp. 7505]|uniref:helix-turn-helix transcriptional regulator n=1 Tax=Virgibacillus sp. 7505 TaxID=2022548 RepID=UPI000BA4FC5E|nr:helix-turn-helix transcriptional regulator [Virgibacillus sp. 7505]PAE17252.1 transcriptional regulator [Virgibacillus sp. 7505]
MRVWLKEFREQRDYTQEKVAKLSGIERSYYTMIEGGKRIPSVTVAQSIGRALGFDWTIFFTQNSNEVTRDEAQEVC